MNGDRAHRQPHSPVQVMERLALQLAVLVEGDVGSGHWFESFQRARHVVLVLKVQVRLGLDQRLKTPRRRAGPVNVTAGFF